MNGPRFTAAALLAGLACAVPAQACSWSYPSGRSPSEIKASREVRRVQGTFRIDMSASDRNGDGLLDRGLIYGRVSTPGYGWNTDHPYSEIAVECAMPVGPLTDANGTFWISRNSQNGRYELLLWEGRHVGPWPWPARPPED